MQHRQYRFSAIVLFACIVLPIHAAPLHIQNDVSACAAIQARAVSTQADFVLADIAIDSHKPVGDCGCLSALIQYRSEVSVGGSPQVLQSGLLAVKHSEEKRLVLATEPGLIADSPVYLRFSCAPPL